MHIIDAHIHLGDMNKPYPKAAMMADLAAAGAAGACIFAFPEDMYRTVDDPQVRRQANEYVLDSAAGEPEINPYYFVWNDWVIPEDFSEYVGIKWHRHADEPTYDYAAPGCEAMIQAIRDRNLPVIIEEEFDNTVHLIERLGGVPVIIPHCGCANGGHERMDIFFDNPHVYFDTSVATPDKVQYILVGVGAGRVIFGSDCSGTSMPFFNFPKIELEKILQLGLSDAELQMILGENIECLVAQVR